MYTVCIILFNLLSLPGYFHFAMSRVNNVLHPLSLHTIFPIERKSLEKTVRKAYRYIHSYFRGRNKKRSSTIYIHHSSSTLSSILLIFSPYSPLEPNQFPARLSHSSLFIKNCILFSIAITYVQNSPSLDVISLRAPT